MAKGLSIHIGLNHVDPAQYEGWNGQLNACEADAKDMRNLAKKQGFQNQTLLLSQHATAENVIGAINQAAQTLTKGDLLFLSYSGHGGQVKDSNFDEEPDRKDETWVLYDRQLVDDELYDLWQDFKAGVRILVLSDSCHSGSVAKDIPAFITGGPRIRAMPSILGEEVETAHKALYRRIQDSHPGSETTKILASVLLISGCQDFQVSQDGERNGAFTGMLKRVWAGGKIQGDYKRFYELILAKMPKDQKPNYFFVGAPNPSFEAQKPFTI
jgi:metacaspase-1